MKSEEEELKKYQKQKIERDRLVSDIEKRNIVCLSEIKNKSDPVTWMCTLCKFQWKARLRSIEKYATQCSNCIRTKRVNNIEEKRGIKCITTKIVSNTQILKKINVIKIKSIT